METRKVQKTTLYFDPNLYYQVKLEALKRDKSITELITEAIIKSLNLKIVDKKKNVWDVLDKFAKKPYKGDVPRDLSTNDKYLMGDRI
jgi:hypothetical protein